MRSLRHLVNGRSHIYGLAGRIHQGQVDGSAGTVGRWRLRVGTGVGPKLMHGVHQRLFLSFGSLGQVESLVLGEFLGGMLHHKALHHQRPVGIKNLDLPAGSLGL